MPRFAYQAIGPDGSTVKGIIDADSSAAAQARLAAGGSIPLSVSQVREKFAAALAGSIGGLGGRVRPEELIIFTKQFRTMYKSGIPLLRLLSVLETQSENRVLKKCIEAMTDDIRQGATLTDAMKRHPKVFSPLYSSMVSAGEMSGALPEVLERLTYIIEHEHKIRSDIRSAMQYPLMVVITLAFAFFFLLIFVVPKFVSIFAKEGLTLPPPTVVALGMHHFITNYWAGLLAGVLGGVVALRYYVKTPPGRYAMDSLLLRLPVFGPLFIKAAMSRFASIFAILQTSGVSVLESLSILTGTMNNSVISRSFDNLRNELSEGKGISGPLSKSGFFPPLVVDMIAVGEESGSLDNMLREVTSHYDDELKHSVGRLADVISPVLIVLLSFVVGFFALAIFMPMWDLIQMIKKTG